MAIVNPAIFGKNTSDRWVPGSLFSQQWMISNPVSSDRSIALSTVFYQGMKFMPISSNF